MRNTVPVKVSAELWSIVKDYCEKKGFKLQHFTDTALEDRLKKLNLIPPNKLKGGN